MTDIPSLTERELLAAAILVLARTGRTRGKVAMVLGIDQATVSDIAREMLPRGVIAARQRRAATNDERETVYMLYRRGWLVTDIARETERPHGTVATWIKRGHDTGLLQKRLPSQCY